MLNSFKDLAWLQKSWHSWIDKTQSKSTGTPSGAPWTPWKMASTLLKACLLIQGLIPPRTLEPPKRPLNILKNIWKQFKKQCYTFQWFKDVWHLSVVLIVLTVCAGRSWGRCRAATAAWHTASSHCWIWLPECCDVHLLPLSDWLKNWPVRSPSDGWWSTGEREWNWEDLRYICDSVWVYE